MGDLKVGGGGWDRAGAAGLARTCVEQWLEQQRVPAPFKAVMRGFRGFFLADPEDLSLLPLVEQFAESGTPGWRRLFRIPGGNDRLATGLAKRLRGALLRGPILRRGLQARHIEWLGKPAPPLASRAIVWDADPWARGGYAYFDPSFDPLWRAWLARPAGRIVFAGEHTSIKYQGYMNGAIETGLRAAAEIG